MKVWMKQESKNLLILAWRQFGFQIFGFRSFSSRFLLSISSLVSPAFDLIFKSSEVIADFHVCSSSYEVRFMGRMPRSPSLFVSLVWICLFILFSSSVSWSSGDIYYFFFLVSFLIDPTLLFTFLKSFDFDLVLLLFLEADHCSPPAVLFN